MTFVNNYVYAEIRIRVPKDLLGLSEFTRRLPEAVEAALKEGADFWESEAGRRLRTVRERYQQAIRIGSTATRKGGVEGSLYLDPQAADLVFQVEEGSKGYSLRDGFLKSAKLRNAPVKMPRAVAASFPRTGQMKAKKWMIIPLNPNHQVPSTSPTFRNFTDTQSPDKWQHPGFKGLNIAYDVASEIRDRFLPEQIDKLIDDIIEG